MKTPSNRSRFPLWFKQSFIIFGIITYLVQSVDILSIFFRHYGTHIRFSQFTVMTVVELILPLALFALAQFFYATKRTMVDRVFIAMAITAAGLWLTSAIQTLFMHLSAVLLPTDFWLTIYVAWPAIIALLLVAGSIYLLRQHKIIPLRPARIVASLAIILGFIWNGGRNILYDPLRYLARTHHSQISNHSIEIGCLLLFLAIAVLTYVLIVRTMPSVSIRLYRSAILMLGSSFILTTLYGTAEFFMRNSNFIGADAFTLATWFSLAITAVMYACSVWWLRQTKP